MHDYRINSFNHTINATVFLMATNTTYKMISVTSYKQDAVWTNKHSVIEFLPPVVKVCSSLTQLTHDLSPLERVFGK